MSLAHRFPRTLGGLALGASAAAGLVFLVAPLVVIVGLSFTASDHLRFPPAGLSLRWYAAFLNDPSYVDAITASLLLAAGAALAALAIGVPAAMGLARRRPRAGRALQLFFASPLILPHVVIGTALLALFTDAGLVGSWPALLLAHTVIVVPYTIRTAAATLSALDPALEEAARDLGATPLTAFCTVVLPLAKPGIVAGALFAFIVSWINVEVSMFLTSVGLQTIPVKLFNYIQYSADPVIAAVSAVTIYLAMAMVVLIDAAVGLERFAAPRA